jgi:hypothetical protein
MNIKSQEFTPQQREDINILMSSLIEEIIQIAPPLFPHLSSGGAIKIMTLSGMNLQMGFEPRNDGLILPNGITPKLKERN